MHLTRPDAVLHYTILGDGPPLILLHAFPSCHEMWVPVTQPLAQRYRVVLPDLRAHGRSTVGEGIATMEKHADDLAALCKQEGIGKAAFAGISIGGYILFEFWRRYRQHIGALVLLNTRAGADTEDARATRLRSADQALERGPEQFLADTLPKLLGETTQRNRKDLVEAARHSMRFMTAEKIAAVQRGMAARPDSTPTLSTIDVPTLVIAGEEDTSAPPAESTRIQQGITGSKLHIIPRAGHYTCLEQPDEVTRLLRQFLDGLKLS
jgi:3-oxoadipate enol-lactonase